MSGEGSIIVRVGNHRARNTLASLVGAMPPGYFDPDRAFGPRMSSPEYREIPAELATEAAKIRGITRPRRPPARLFPYLSISGD